MSDAAAVIELEVPARAEFVRIVRLMVAGVGNVARFNLEEIEDLKLAVGEACYMTFHGVRSAEARVRIRVTPLDDCVEVEVTRSNPAATGAWLGIDDSVPETGIGVALLEHLVDEVDFAVERHMTRIRLMKRRVVCPA